MLQRYNISIFRQNITEELTKHSEFETFALMLLRQISIDASG